MTRCTKLTLLKVIYFKSLARAQAFLISSSTCSSSLSVSELLSIWENVWRVKHYMEIGKRNNLIDSTSDNLMSKQVPSYLRPRQYHQTFQFTGKHKLKQNTTTRKLSYIRNTGYHLIEGNKLPCHCPLNMIVFVIMWQMMLPLHLALCNFTMWRCLIL